MRTYITVDPFGDAQPQYEDIEGLLHHVHHHAFLLQGTGRL